jgi:hypothetical protein
VFSSKSSAQKWKNKLNRRTNRVCYCYNMDQYGYEKADFKEIQLNDEKVLEVFNMLDEINKK